jgi:hypothetical protein
MPSDILIPTQRTRLKRLPERGSHERAAIHAILDEGLFCHLAFAIDGEPHVIPTIYARRDDRLYLHGSKANRALRALKRGGQACVCVTLLDGLVLARSAFHHSMNYRSVILYGEAREVADAGEKLEALRALVEHVVPGRWNDVRGPSASELLRTTVLVLPIAEGSAKLRTGFAREEEADYELTCWAGVIPLRLSSRAPISDPRLQTGITPPPYATRYARPRTEPPVDE